MAVPPQAVRIAAVVALGVAPGFVQGQEGLELTPGSQWRYLSRPGEVLTLTVLEPLAPGVSMNGSRVARVIVDAKGFRSFASDPSLGNVLYQACMVLDEVAFDSPLAEFIGRVEVDRGSVCENAANGVSFYSFEEVADFLEQPILSPPRSRPEPVNGLQFYGIAPISHAAPVYPAEVTSKQDGWVLLQFTVTAEGRLEEVEVVDASPEGLFEASALRYASIARFRQKVIEGDAVSVSGVRQVITYTHDRGRRVWVIVE